MGENINISFFELQFDYIATAAPSNNPTTPTARPTYIPSLSPTNAHSSASTAPSTEVPSAPPTTETLSPNNKPKTSADMLQTQDVDDENKSEKSKGIAFLTEDVMYIIIIATGAAICGCVLCILFVLCA
eukprot:356305_1